MLERDDDMSELDHYQFGSVYKSKIPKEEAEKFAALFGEGSLALTKLIQFCIVSDIPTLASCKGHPENLNVLDRLVETGYITFRIDNDYDFASFLAELPIASKNITASLDYNLESGRTVTLYVPATKKNMSEEYFKHILLVLQEYVLKKNHGEKISIHPEIEKIVKYIYMVPGTEIFEITSKGYRKLERNGMYTKKVAQCPHYDQTGLLHRNMSEELRKEQLDNFLHSIRRK